MLNWESLQSACLSCTRCPLSQTRHHVVFGVGPQDAEVLFVGEGPGENEDLQGEPFVGAAGKFLDEMLTIIDLGRHNCYITNIIKCRPPKNRDPMQTEQDACIDFLRAQTKLLKPKIIVCLGRIAAMKLIRPDFKITPVQLQNITDTETSHASKQGCLFQDRNLAGRSRQFLDFIKCQILFLDLFPFYLFQKVVQVLTQHLLFVGYFQ